MGRVQIAPGQAQHQHFGSGDVAGEGDVVLVAQAGNVGYVPGHAFVGGIVEEENQVELVIGNAGTDLLAASVGVGEEAVDVQSGRFGHHMTGGVGGVEVVLGQDTGIGRAELDHQILLVVVGHQSDVHEGDSFLNYLIRSRGTRCPWRRWAMLR